MLEAIRGGVGTIQSIVPIIYPTIDRKLSSAAALSVQAHVEHLHTGATRCRETTRVGEPDGGAADQRQHLERAIERQLRTGQLRAMMWLADRAKVAPPPNPSTPDQELRAILNALTTAELSEFAALGDES